MRLISLIVLIMYECCNATELHLAWDNPIYSNDTNIIVELWHSIDLINWTIKDVVPSSQTNYFTPCNLDQEYFKIRNRELTTGLASVWSY